MSKKRKNLSIVHLEVDISNSRFSIWISFLQVLYFKELILEFETGDLRWHRLIVLSVKIFDFKGVKDCATFVFIILQSFLVRTVIIGMFVAPLATAAERKAEAAALSLAIGPRQDGIHIEAK